MQPGGGGGHGAFAAGVDSLVAFGVRGHRGPADIGRQRHFADALEHLRRMFREAQFKQLAKPAEHFGFDNLPGSTGKAQAAASLRRLARPQLRQRPIRPGDPLDQCFHLAAAPLAAAQPRPHHPGIVENEQIPGGQ